MKTRAFVDLGKKAHALQVGHLRGGQPLQIERAEGIHLYTTDDRRIIDFNSQLMSVRGGVELNFPSMRYMVFEVLVGAQS